MQYTIKQLREEIFKDVYQVYDVFKDFFGEEFVDLQYIPNDEDLVDTIYSCTDIGTIESAFPFELSEEDLTDIKTRYAIFRFSILVWWPKVKVSNEFDKYIMIYDLYAKIELTAKGFIPTENIGFTLNRATYPLDQWLCGYMHSHINTIPIHSLTEFQKPCLGRGPIIGTITSLKEHISEGFDETKWMLFCQELSQYVTVESIAGVPYNKLENVSLHTQNSEYRGFSNPSPGPLNSAVEGMEKAFPLSDFIKYYLHHGHFSINYKNKEFICGMSYFDYIIDVSNAFIEYFNNHVSDKRLVLYLKDFKTIKKVVISKGEFCTLRTRTSSDYSAYQDRKVCDFKGQEIKLKILESEMEKPHETTVLSQDLAMYIVNGILRTINYHYTNEYTRNQNQLTGTSEESASSDKKVYYI